MSILKKLKSYFQKKQYPFVAKGDNWTDRQQSKPVAVLWAFSTWKWEFITQYLPEYRILLASTKTPWNRQKKFLDGCEGLTFIFWGLWGLETRPEVREYAELRGIPVFRMEDGFIRSNDLGCKHTLPLSLVLDKRGMYFDANRPSDLEDLLSSYNFSQYPELLVVSRQLMSVMRTLRVSKYNASESIDILSILGPKRSYRILVVGQLESDASLRYGLAHDWTNRKLLQKAHADYPEAEIIYRPHPDTLHLRREDSISEDQADFYRVCTEPVVLADLFAQVDHVYTMTSLSGMEALIHGLPVTVVGMPFYAGWGLTHDAQDSERRTRTLTLEELFCGVYILYPRYLADLDSPVAGCAETMVAVVKHRLKGVPWTFSEALPE